MREQAEADPRGEGVSMTTDSLLGPALAEAVERFFEGNNHWHGPLWKQVADLTAQQALWRPAPERHCIWEIVRHITFWRRYLLAMMAGAPTPDWRAHNWTLPERTDEAAWQEDLAELRRVQDELVAALRSRSASQLLAPDEQGRYARFVLETGIIGHDSYHTGQIAYIRALMGRAPVD